MVDTNANPMFQSTGIDDAPASTVGNTNKYADKVAYAKTSGHQTHSAPPRNTMIRAHNNPVESAKQYRGTPY
jgi:hypothetical protein